jgi:small subunit ribosomal protein S5
LAGFKDVKTKVVGSRHPHNTVKAVFKALSEIETPEELAERQGREMVQARARALA